MSTSPLNPNSIRTAAAAVTAVIAMSLLATATPALAADVERPYLVTSTSGTIASHATQIATAGATITDTYPTLKTVDVAMTTREAAALAAQPGLAVEPDAIVRAADTITPPTWGLDRIDQVALPLNSQYTLPAEEAGTGVSAYVLDTGIYAANVQFGSRVTVGYSAINDGLGTSDCSGHGTHVAGTLGGSTVGVARNVTIIPVRVLDCAAASTLSAVIDGINWVIADHAAGVPAVANLSFGAGKSVALADAVAALIADGVTVIVAAGNSNVDACTASPADAPGALTVAATGSNDARAAYSNFGTCVDLFAPGGSGNLNDLIVSAGTTGPTALAARAGTSMSAPSVAGMAVRYLSRFPNATPAAVNAAILAAATADIVTNTGLGTPNKLLATGQYGFGSAPVLSAPAAPAAVTATGGPGAVTVIWTAPAFTGNSPITGYTVKLVNGSTAGTSVTLPSSATSYTFNALPGGTAYSAAISAINAIGTGAPGTTPAVTVTAPLPATLPASPGTATVTTAVATATVAWAAPMNTGNTAITGYTVKLINATTKAVVASTTASPNLRTMKFNALASGLTVYATVAATNIKGTGPAITTTSAAVAGTPAAPTGLTATAGLSSATFTWTAPVNTGGLNLTAYTLVVKNAATGATVTTLTTLPSTKTTSIPLTAGTSYTATVTAANTVGKGVTSTTATVTLASLATAATPASLATAVTAIKATYPFTLKATITWTAPTSLGGTKLVRYEYRTSTITGGTLTWSPWTSTSTRTSVTITGTVKGTTRPIEVRAVTLAGAGAPTQIVLTPTI